MFQEAAQETMGQLTTDRIKRLPNLSVCKVDIDMLILPYVGQHWVCIDMQRYTLICVYVFRRVSVCMASGVFGCVFGCVQMCVCVCVCVCHQMFQMCEYFFR
jgi:hypothetical protein